MEWIKVKVKHVDYDFNSADDKTFRAWIELMAFTAGLEKIPTQEQMEHRISKECVNSLTKVLQNNNTTLTDVLLKVLEDVNRANDKKEHYRLYMKKYMESYRHVLCKGSVNGQLNGKEVEVEVDVEVEDKVDDEKKEEAIPPSAIAPTQDFIFSLKNNVAYKHINIDTELAKMDAWLSAHAGRKKTKRFVINWLNKVEVPLGVSPKPHKIHYVSTADLLVKQYATENKPKDKP